MSQKILVVDDSRTVCKVVQWVYHAQPYTVDVASNGQEALAKLQTGTYAAAIIDYFLPDQSGFDLTRALRARGLTASLPVVLLTGAHHPYDAGDIAGCGADGSIDKPFKTDDLIETVANAIASAGNRPSAAPAPPAPEPVFEEEDEDEDLMILDEEEEEFILDVEEDEPAPAPLPPRRSAIAPPPPSAPTPVPDLTPPRPSAPISGGFKRLKPSLPGPPSPTRKPSGGFKRLRPPGAPGGPPSPFGKKRNLEQTAENEAVSQESAQPPTAPVRQPIAPPAPEPIAPPAPEPVTVPTPEPMQPVAAKPAPEPAPQDEPIAPVAPKAAATVRADSVPAGLRATAPVEVDESAIRDAVKELLPAIVKEYLTAMLKQTGQKLEIYSQKKIDHFVENELEGIAERILRERQ